MVMSADNIAFGAARPELLTATRAAIRSGRLTRAHGLLLAATVLEPQNFEAWLLLGWISPDPSAAITYFQRALELDPGNLLAKDGLAWATERASGARPNASRDAIGASPEVAIPVQGDLETTKAGDLLTGHHEILRRDNLEIDDACVGQAGWPIDQPKIPVQDDSKITDAPASMRSDIASRASSQRRSFNRNLIAPPVYLFALILAETLTTHGLPQAGLALYCLLLVALPAHAVLAPRGPLQRLPLALALAPLIRLLSLSLPLANFPFIYWYLIVGTPLFIAGFVAARVLGYSRAKIGLMFPIDSWQLGVGLSGIGVGYVEYLILRPLPLIHALTWDQVWLPAVILLIFTGLLEEFLFRGLMQRAATESLGRIGILYVAVLFAALHVGYYSLLDVVFVFGVGLYFGLVVARTGSIAGVTLAHGLANIGLLLIFPLLRG